MTRRAATTVPLGVLSAIADLWTYDLLSTDLFDTVLLRDRSTETERLAISARRASAELDLDPNVLIELRWSFHSIAYSAVAMERPQGDASLVSITRTMAAALGLGNDAADVLRRTEVGVDIEHLFPNRPLLKLLGRVRAGGRRVIAVSDTYYAKSDLEQILTCVIGDGPFAAVYSSADLGMTKQGGRVFDLVATRERVSADRILHVGDSQSADVRMARAAGWSARHVPRSQASVLGRHIGALRSLPLIVRRAR